MSDGQTRVLLVDDDGVVAGSLAAFLGDIGYDTTTAGSADEALSRLDEARANDESEYVVMIVDLALPDRPGLDLIREVRQQRFDVVPVAITGYGTIESAVKAIRLGAFDYLTKPLVDDELAVVVEKAVQQQKLLAENTSLRRQLDQRGSALDQIQGADPRMCRIFDTVEAVASSKTTVLMSGESGTGKSLIARAIHKRSARADKPFVDLSCGSIPETLLESELFGHVRGAFTGAHSDKPGRFLAADSGTLFLDEINSASPGMQLKLLRVLQERRFEPVGSNEPIEVDVRVILASNEPLEDLVANGQFRQDLYYRINVVMIQVPPLRERVGDIPLLAEHFLQVKGREAGRQVTRFTDDALEAMCRYAYPGNVRELENVVERAVVLTRSTQITLDDLPPHVVENSTGKLLATAAPPEPEGEYRPRPLKDALEEPERRIILAALEANDWNRQKTADDLEINRTTLYKKMKQYGLGG